MIRVLVADDHPVVRAGLVFVLTSADDIVVVADVADGRAALDHPALDNTDVLVLDLAMPVLDGLSVLDELARRPTRPRTLVLTSMGEDARIVRAVESGADGVLFKDSPASEILDAIRAVATGRTVLASDAAAKLQSAATRPSLSAREVEVLQLVARGTSNAAIGRELFISEATVKTHLQHCFDKLGAADRAHAVTIAGQLGLL